MGSELLIEEDGYRLALKPTASELGCVGRAVYAVTHQHEAGAPRMFPVSIRYGIPLLIVVFTAILAAYTVQKGWGAPETVVRGEGVSQTISRIAMLQKQFSMHSPRVTASALHRGCHSSAVLRSRSLLCPLHGIGSASSGIRSTGRSGECLATTRGHSDVDTTGWV